MRGLSARRIASTALCATLLVGIAGPVAVAADPARERAHATSRAPVPGADALLAQVKGLGDLGSLLAPVTALLNVVLKADNGQLSPDQAQTLVNAVKDAITKITAAVPAAATPTTAASPTLSTVASPASRPSLMKPGDGGRAPSAKDLRSDALAGLQKAVDALLAADTSGDVAQVVPADTGVLTALVDFLAVTLLGSGLPAPDLPGLPALPSLPSPIG